MTDTSTDDGEDEQSWARLGNETTRADIYCYEKHKQEWQEEAEHHGQSLSRYLYDLIEEARSYRKGGLPLLETKARHLYQLLSVSETANGQFRIRFLNQGKLLLKSLKAEVSRRTIKYGEGHWNVLFSLGVVTLLYSLVYPIWGLRKGNRVLRYTISLDNILSYGIYIDWDIWFNSIYFSVVTFTTLGYGDIRPVGFARYIAASEAVIGSSLMALLVFILGRRAT